MLTIYDLPSELLAEIAISSDVPTVLNLCAVSRHVRAAVRNATVFKGLLDRSPVVKRFKKKWTDVLVPMQPSIDMWQRCAMADHQALIALPYSSNGMWWIPADVHVPQLAQLAILRHPYFTTSIWRQIFGGSPMAIFAMNVSGLIVQHRYQRLCLADINAEFREDTTRTCEDQVMTLDEAMFNVHEMLSDKFYYYGDEYSTIEIPTIERFFLTSCQFESFEQWHMKSVQSIILQGNWEGFLEGNVGWVDNPNKPNDVNARFHFETADDTVHLWARHHGRSYKLIGYPTYDNTPFELIEHTETVNPRNGHVWYCMLTVFGITGIVWGPTDEGRANIAKFWLWPSRDIEDIDAAEGATM